MEKSLFELNEKIINIENDLDFLAILKKDADIQKSIDYCNEQIRQIRKEMEQIEKNVNKEKTMLKVGDKVYSWDDIKDDIETYSILRGSRPTAWEDSYMVIGTVVDLNPDFVEIQLVENDDVTVTCDIDFVFHVGTGPVMTKEYEEAE